MNESRPRWFYGWWVALITALGLFLGPIPVIVFCFGIFLRPLVQEFHSTRGAVSLAFTTFSIVQALSLPLVGRLVDRIGTRKVILPFSILAGLILLATSFFSGRLWQIYLFYGSMGFLICGLGPVSYGTLISHWFDQQRGLALGVMMAGLGTGAFIMPSVAQNLIGVFGWRHAFEVFGVAILLIKVPLVSIFLKERPESIGLLPDGDAYPVTRAKGTFSDPGMSLSQALRCQTYWLLFFTFAIVSGSGQGSYTHIAAILADRGSSAQTAAFATSLFGAGLLIGRAGSGYLLDRFFAPRVAAIIFTFAAAGISLLRISGSQVLAFAAAILVGLGIGTEGDVMAYLASRYFGLRSFAAIYGLTFSAFVLGGGSGVYLMDRTFDVTGYYSLALNLFSILTLSGAALMLRLGPYLYKRQELETNRPALDQFLESRSPEPKKRKPGGRTCGTAY
jgi:MFS family permease